MSTTTAPRRLVLEDCPEFSTPLQVAKLLGVNYRLVLSWIADGKLPAINTSRGEGSAAVYRIHRRALEQALAELITC